MIKTKRKGPSEETRIKMQEKKEEKVKKLFNVCGFGVEYNTYNWIIREDKKMFYFSSFLNLLQDIVAMTVKRGMAKSKNLEDAIETIKKENERFLKELKEIIKDKVIKSEHYNDFN